MLITNPHLQLGGGVAKAIARESAAIIQEEGVRFTKIIVKEAVRIITEKETTLREIYFCSYGRETIRHFVQCFNLNDTPQFAAGRFITMKRL